MYLVNGIKMKSYCISFCFVHDGIEGKEFVEIESWDPQLQVKLHGFSGRNLDLHVDFFSLLKIFLKLSPITFLVLLPSLLCNCTIDVAHVGCRATVAVGSGGVYMIPVRVSFRYEI